MWADGTQLTYTHWAKNEPQKDGADDKDCVVMLNKRKTWKTVSCAGPVYDTIVCEIILDKDPIGIIGWIAIP